MTPEEILHAALIADTTVSGLVGAKVFADKIEQCTERPAVVYQRHNTDPRYTIHGMHYADFVTIAVVIHAKERADADAIAEAVDVALTAAEFWQTQQEGGFEPEIDATSVAQLYTYFHTG